MVGQTRRRTKFKLRHYHPAAPLAALLHYIQNRGQHAPLVYLDVPPLTREQVLKVLVLLLSELQAQPPTQSA